MLNIFRESTLNVPIPFSPFKNNSVQWNQIHDRLYILYWMNRLYVLKTFERLYHSQIRCILNTYWIFSHKKVIRILKKQIGTQITVKTWLFCWDPGIYAVNIIKHLPIKIEEWKQVKLTLDTHRKCKYAVQIFST